MRRNLVYSIVIGLVFNFCGCKQDSDEYIYPRRAVQAAQLSKWMSAAKDPLCFTDYDMIVTSSPPSEVSAILDRAYKAGAKEWTHDVTICYKTCLRTVKTFDNRPPNWIYRAALLSPAHAHEIAVYENKIRGCDWLIRDQHGNAIEIYSSNHVLTDWSPYCPLGLWNGKAYVGNDTLYIGNTQGLTVYEWLAGPMKNNVILNREFMNTYDVICLDDDPFVGSPSWHVPNTTLYHLRSNAPSEKQTGRKANRFTEIAKQSRARTNVQLAEEMSRLPGSAVDWGAFDRELPEALNRAEQRAMSQFTTHSMVDIHHYNRACLPAVLAYHEEFVGGLNRQFIMLAQTPMLSAKLDSSFAASAHEVFNGSILPSYGFGGYWPQGNIYEGWKMWDALDRIYHPYGFNTHPKLDAMQGDNVCFVECLVKDNWSYELQCQRARESLAHALVGGNSRFHSAFKKDESGIGYSRGETELFTFSEQEFILGKARTECLEYIDPAFLDKPLYYRYFQNDKNQYTVVINMHEISIHGIPARDAVWFEGLWPRLHEKEVEF